MSLCPSQQPRRAPPTTRCSPCTRRGRQVINDSVASCPLALRSLLAAVVSSCKAHFGADSADEVALRACNGLFFLRFLVPHGLLAPLASGITIEPPTEGASRSLLLTSKALICLANLVEFGAKEPYMEPLNEPFLRPHLPLMKAFTAALATVPAEQAAGRAAAHSPRLSLAHSPRLSLSAAPPPPPPDAEAQLTLSLAATFAFLRRRANAVIERAEASGYLDDVKALFKAHHRINPHVPDPYEAWQKGTAGGAGGGVRDVEGK